MQGTLFPDSDKGNVFLKFNNINLTW